MGYCQERKNNPYDESNYEEIKRGRYETTKLYAVTSKNKTDTQYTLVKIFNDSTYNDSIYAKHYLYQGLLDGPSEMFFWGKSGGKTFYKKGKRHGESVVLRNDSTVGQRGFYDRGKRTGVGEFYDSNGKLFKKKYFDAGKFLKQEIYHRDGHLVRTELEESTTY